ncbi:MAG: DUF362 domain-containing protein [Lachnospiraceae bacterium]|nr:DUF362 domain-containing protein [Lachnospiraceae bacterium]
MNENLKNFPPVSIVPCMDYQESHVESALYEAIKRVDDLSWVKPGMKIGIKVNLVSHMKPETAVTTHPQIVVALCKLLSERGAEPIVGDSPGGLFTAAIVNGIYRAAEMQRVEEVGGKLNQNFDQELHENPEGVKAKRLDCTSWLLQCDAIINVCKLKTHGMMGMSAAAKNFFGTIPGLLKPEYHFHYPNPMDFANMLIDIDEFYRSGFGFRLNIVDAVVGMEGNGPTMGTPRQIGALLASTSPYPLDTVCAELIGLKREEVQTLQAAYERGLGPADISEVAVLGDVDTFKIADFELIKERMNIEFVNDLVGVKGKLYHWILSTAMTSRPKPEKDLCIGCGKCGEICPGHAIEMNPAKLSKGKGLPVIDKNKCIRCFCCQEFCPVGAMKVHRSAIAKVLNRR